MDKSQYLKAREYELLAILLPDKPEEETKAAIDAMLGYITDQGGTVDSTNTESPWGRRRLAYTVRHEGVDYRDGHYALVYFTAMPSALAEIEREFKLDVNIIRYLLLIQDPEMGEKIDEAQLAAEAAEREAAEEAANADAATAALAEQAAAEKASATEEAATEEAPAAEEAAPEEAPAAEEAVSEEAPATEEAATEEAQAAEEAATEEAPAAEEAATEEAPAAEEEAPAESDEDKADA